MAFEVILTEDDIRVLQDALAEFTMLNAEGRCAVEYPLSREKANALLRKLDMAQAWSESGVSNYSKDK